MNEEPKTNEGQIRFWNSGPGQNWVKYQQTLDACFRNINSLLLDNAGIRPGWQVLDIGCGSGDTSLGIARHFGDEISVLGLDVSAPLLDLARQRCRDQGAANVSFLEADVQAQIPSRDKFDLAVSRFGVMFFTRPVIAFGNIHSAMKPGGFVVFVAWSTANENPWFQIPRDAAISVLGKGTPAAPRDPGPTAFSDPGYVEDILQQAGFGEVHVRVEDSSISTSFAIEEMTELACNLGPAFRLMKEKNGSSEDAQAIRRIVLKQFSPYQTDSGFDIPVKLVTAKATRT
jgi:SAM-dependent methyltransferase